MFDPHTDCSICKTDNNNQEGTTMTDSNNQEGTTNMATDYTDYTTAAATNLIEAELREKIAALQIERDQAKAREARTDTELESVRSAYRLLKSSLQNDLKEWADQYIQPGDDDYKELSELMVNNGLEGLKRTFTVSVSVRYDFEVEVEATDEDEARDEVDNNITSYAQDYVYLNDSPDDIDIDVSEA